MHVQVALHPVILEAEFAEPEVRLAAEHVDEEGHGFGQVRHGDADMLHAAQPGQLAVGQRVGAKGSYRLHGRSSVVVVRVRIAHGAARCSPAQPMPPGKPLIWRHQSRSRGHQPVKTLTGVTPGGQVESGLNARSRRIPQSDALVAECSLARDLVRAAHPTVELGVAR
ncbi:hypothetical protein D9M68_775150 [compost metagenome]